MRTWEKMFLAILATGIAAACGGYYFGQSQTRSAAHNLGYANAKKDFGHQISGYDNLLVENSQLANDYNKLVEDYNNLRNSAINYVNTTSYQPRTPITCNTYNYSLLNSSTTTCY